MGNYVIYHLHSMYSNGVTNIDSITGYQQYVDFAKENGMKAMAFSEHGSVFSWLKKKEAIEKAGMKYIHAEEFYITEKLYEDEYPDVPDEFYEASLGEDSLEVQKELDESIAVNRKKLKDNYHCVLIAKNYDGVKELNKLSSVSFNRDDGHFYYRPRITFDELINTSDNIIVTTACLASILNKGNDALRDKYIGFLRKNKHRCFLEIQHHDVDDQKEYNKYLWGLSKTIDVPLIAGTDTHALNEEHMKGRAIMQKSKNVHFAEEDKWDLTAKTYDELVAAYKKQDSLPMEVVLEAIDNTNKMADMIEEFEVTREYKYPHLWEDPEGLIRQKIKEGIVRRGVDKYPNYQDYLDRIEHEMSAYIHNGAIDFMLLMEDIISWMRDHDIMPGYGRGSCNGSVIAWLLGITEMDSIKHKLNFERFMNVERVSLSDIDTDIPPSKIEDVKQYIMSKPGLYCSDIITFNTVSDKGAIRDVGRALEIPLSEVGEICDCVDNAKEYEKVRKKYSELFYYVDLVKGVIVSIGTHPCGMIVSPQSLDDNVGLCSTSTSPYPVSELYMKEVDSLNYVKLDLLKLDTIEIINDTCELAGIERLTPDNVDINDDNVWNAMREDTAGIFQWNSGTGSDYIKKLLSDSTIKKFKKVMPNIDKMTLLSIGNSAIRPAGESYREDLANGVVRTTGSKPIDEFLSNTFGFLVFQEQIISFLHEYCGFTMGEADVVRRGFAKKTGTEAMIPVIVNGGYLNGNENHYIDGYIKTMKDRYGISEKKSEKDIIAFIKVIEDASNYLFSLNHSQPYSYEGYVCAWLRTYYPAEFLTVSLNVNADKEEKTKELTAYAKKCGIRIEAPRYGHSKSGYECDAKNNVIYKGIKSIKYMNDKIADELMDASTHHFSNFMDLLYYIDRKTTVDKRQLLILIKLSFFSDFGDINYLLKLYELFDAFGDKKFVQKSKLEQFGISEQLVRDIAEKETATRFNVDIKRFLNKAAKNIEFQPCSLADKIKYQIELLGYTDYIVPDADPRCAFIMDVDTKYTPQVDAYCLRNGAVRKFKIHKSKNPKEKEVKMTWKLLPLEVGDVIYIKDFKRKQAVKKVDDKWVPVDGKFNFWINDYKKLKI